ncbi:hypothetical protein SAMN04487818_10632 [Actinokineospora terrae]|uniref:Uncharacterized protein n=1 Tax=Actinokineospora terrae TaxID=155974 RepID=A0A1H9T234_9PSEU|nr:hypothetical protein SAMN04487818_10632 [Actinokineospora terrae]
MAGGGADSQHAAASTRAQCRPITAAAGGAIRVGHRSSASCHRPTRRHRPQWASSISTSGRALQCRRVSRRRQTHDEVPVVEAVPRLSGYPAPGELDDFAFPVGVRLVDDVHRRHEKSPRLPGTPHRRCRRRRREDDRVRGQSLPLARRSLAVRLWWSSGRIGGFGVDGVTGRPLAGVGGRFGGFRFDVAYRHVEVPLRFWRASRRRSTVVDVLWTLRAAALSSSPGAAAVPRAAFPLTWLDFSGGRKRPYTCGPPVRTASGPRSHRPGQSICPLLATTITAPT